MAKRRLVKKTEQAPQAEDESSEEEDALAKEIRLQKLRRERDNLKTELATFHAGFDSAAAYEADIKRREADLTINLGKMEQERRDLNAQFEALTEDLRLRFDEGWSALEEARECAADGLPLLKEAYGVCFQLPKLAESILGVARAIQRTAEKRRVPLPEVFKRDMEAVEQSVESLEEQLELRRRVIMELDRPQYLSLGVDGEEQVGEDEPTDVEMFH